MKTLAQQIIQESGYDFDYPISESHIEGLLNIAIAKVSNREEGRELQEIEIRQQSEGCLISLHGDSTDGVKTVFMICERDGEIPSSIEMDLTNEQAKEFASWLSPSSTPLEQKELKSLDSIKKTQQ